MVFRVLLLLFAGISPLVSCAQQDSIHVYIAPYKNDAAGAYSLIHDDFGAEYARGIEQYADSMAFNRKLPFSFAIITKECDEENWEDARLLMKHGHQPVNHSHSHLCGTPQSWCTFGNWDEKDFPVEIDLSTQLIQQNTGKHPAFFIFPFDLNTDTMVAYLVAKGYAGTRAGVQNRLQTSAQLVPFYLNYNVLRPEQPFTVCNQFADQAIQKKAWAIRVMHGVQDESWGAPSVETYRGHLNYLKQKVDSNQLWVATLSDVLWYITQQRGYEVKVTKWKPELRPDKKGFQAVEKISFTKVETDPVYEPEEVANEKTLKATASHKTVTVVIIQPRLTGGVLVYQNKKQLSHRYSGDKLLIEADPEAGDLTLEYLH